MPTFKDYDQSQAVFRDIRPLDLLEEGHPARVFDRVVELLDLEELYGQYGEEGKPGEALAHQGREQDTCSLVCSEPGPGGGYPPGPGSG